MKFNSLVPEFEVSDMSQSLDFYTRILGFKIEFDRPESKFAYLSFYGSQLMLCEHKPDGEWVTGELVHPFGRGSHLQIHTPSITDMLKILNNYEIPIFKGPYETWYPIKDNMLSGTREFLIQDPDGYLLRFQEDIEDRENIEGFTTSQRILLNSKILEGEADIEVGRVKECNADMLNQITEEVIAEKEQLSIGREFMRKYFKTFKALSK